MARWLVETKGFKLKDRYVAEHDTDLLDRFEQRYTFPLRLQLTVHEERKVPSWAKEQSELARFMLRRGLLSKLKERSRFFAKQPIP